MDRIIFYDTETTGFCPLNVYSPFNRILEISAQTVTPDGVPSSVLSSDVFDSVVNMGMMVPAQSSAIHHVTNDMVNAAETSEIVLGKFLEYLQYDKYANVYLVAHNNKGFDEIVLRREMHRVSGRWDTIPDNVVFIDTLVLFKRYYPNMKSYSLENLHKYFRGKPIQNAHRSGADVAALIDLSKQYLLHRPDWKLPADDMDCMLNVKYLGPWRCGLVYKHTGATSISGLRAKFNGPREFAAWLSTIGVKTVSQCMIITHQVFNLTLEEVYNVFPMLIDGCYDAVDVYTSVKHRADNGIVIPPTKRLYIQGQTLVRYKIN